MAHYGDGKHNENMEHTPSKYEITDAVTHRTVYFTIESNEGTVYNVNLIENEWQDEWVVMDEDGNRIDDDSELYDELTTLCENLLLEGEDK